MKMFLVEEHCPGKSTEMASVERGDWEGEVDAQEYDKGSAGQEEYDDQYDSDDSRNELDENTLVGRWGE